MSVYAVTREAGGAWTDGAGAFEQPGVSDHAAFMNDLAAEGVVLFAGPVAGTEAGRIRVLAIMRAEDEPALRQRLADDPWERAGLLHTTTIEPWNLIVGAERVVAERESP